MKGHPLAPVVENKKFWADLGLELDARGSPLTNLDNLVRVLENHPWLAGKIWHDEFHQKIFTTWARTGGAEPDPRREWSDADELFLTQFIQRNFALPKTRVETAAQAVRLIAARDTRNEPRDWMAGLEWDGIERIPHFFFECFGAAENEYTVKIGINFWVGLAARVFNPGCQMDHMVVLKGDQGIGKSNALRILGGPWYSEAHESIAGKDFFLILPGKLIVEIAELDSFNRAETTRVKQVISCPVDRYRAPYASHSQDYPRMSIFVGSTNEETFLKDFTGARRFWPVECGKIDLEYIAANRDQYFAESSHLLKSGEKWWETPPLLTSEIQENRFISDAWTDIIREYLFGRSDVRLADIACEGLKIDIQNFDMGKHKRIGRILRKLGWTDVRKRLTPGQNPDRVWNKKTPQ